MNAKLPQTIENYFQASNARNVEDMVKTFADEALVRDEGREHLGSAEIRAWIEETLSSYSPQAEPCTVNEADGEIVVTARVSGTFPGSPADLNFAFRLQGEQIGALHIRA